MLTTSRINAIKGEISVPGDKSISHRAVMLSALCSGKSIIKGFLKGEDCISTINCCRRLGIEIEETGGSVLVNGKGLYGLKEPEDVLDAGNSGTTMRLISGILAGQDFMSVITGDASLRKRPMTRVAVPLREMGASIDGRDGGRLAPLTIRGGKLKAINYSMPVPSAQVKSAVLLAGLYADGVTTVVEKTASRDHTERMLEYFGANIKSDNGIISLSRSELTGCEVNVPGDISSAAFFIAAAAALPGSELLVRNIGINPTRTGILDVLKDMGADISLENVKMVSGEEAADIVVKGRKLHGTMVKGDIIPRLIDEIPVIAAIAAVCEGETRITGAEELKVKESDRITAMVSEMKKLGIDITGLEDGMIIKGLARISGGTVESYNDHRIAMSMAVCGLFAEAPVKVKGSECVAISFPGFEKKLQEITG